MTGLRILTWHVHGNYLWYLTQAPHHFYLPVKPDRPHPYQGRRGTFPWGDNVHEVPAEEVAQRDFDLVLFQSRDNYLTGQHEILSDAQRKLPRIYLEHDTPVGHPTNTRHVLDDPDVLLVHVTAFNQLMYDCGRTPTRVIDHGVLVPADVCYTGELERGIVVVNDMPRRGRLAGADIFEKARRDVPLDLVGMNAVAMGGLGEIQPPELAAFECRYRFFFHPIRYTSLGLAPLEAMTLGMPIVTLATTEMVTVIENGVNGFIDTSVQRLIRGMRELLKDVGMARRMGAAARQRALERFGIERFVRDWNQTFAEVAG